MKNYYTPDDRWEIICKVNTPEEYHSQYIIEGRFHSGVHKDVVGAFKRVEHITALAYYYYPLYDEATNKMLRNMEMGLKKKAEELNIPLFNVNKKGEHRSKMFAQLVNETCKGKHRASLKKRFARARKIRNMEMHPSGNHLKGMIGKPIANIKQFINILNELFLNDSEAKKLHNLRTKVADQIEQFNKNPYPIKEAPTDKPRLIHNILKHEVFDNVLFLACEGVLKNAYTKISNLTLPEPIIYCIKDYNITANNINGRTLDGMEISLNKTGHATNLQLSKAFEEQLSQLESMNKNSYKANLINDAGWKFTEMQYDLSPGIYGNNANAAD